MEETTKSTEECSSNEVVITAEVLEAKIASSLQGVHLVKACDLSDGCGAKYEIEVICEEFKGKPLIAQHRMIHKAIEEERKHIHALTLKTKAP